MELVSTKMTITRPKWSRTRRAKKMRSRMKEKFAKAMRRHRDRVKSGAEPAIRQWWPVEGDSHFQEVVS